MNGDGRRASRIVPVTLEPAGDDACWLGGLCPECGAMPEGAGADDPAAPCWRCGAVRSRTVEDGDTSAEDDGASGSAGQGSDGSANGPDDLGA